MNTTQINPTGLTSIAPHVWVKVSKTQGGTADYTVEADGMPVERFTSIERMLARAEVIAADYEGEKAKRLAAKAAYAAKREAEAAARREAEQAQQVAEQAPVETVSTLATAKQVAYIMRLIAKGAHREGGFLAGPTTHEGVGAMTRHEASAYIDSLTGQY